MLEAREPSAKYLARQQPVLVREFDLLAGAPGSAARLRDLILTLAVQGRLVPQDPSEETAAAMLGRIRVEKARLIDAGTIQRPRATVGVIDEDKPFVLPRGWAWVRLPEITYDHGQTVPAADFTYIDVGTIDNERAAVNDTVQVLRAADAPSRARKRVTVGTLLYSTVRPYLKNIAIIEKAYSPSAIASTAFAILHPHTGVLGKYLLYYLRSSIFTEFVAGKMVGVAYPAINDASFFQGVVALPPSSEQALIVARVDELMRLCDALEAKGRLEAEQHARLLSTLLGTLTDSATPEELAANWQRVAEHFDLLLDRPEAVDVVERALVQLALRGLLTQQDLTDEPAAEFVPRINFGRATRRPSTPAPLLADADGEGLPAGWCVTNVGSVAECLDYMRRPVKKSEREGRATAVPYYGANGQVGWIGEHLFDEELVLVVEDETFIGRTKPFSYVVRGKSWVNNHAHVLRPLGGMTADYLNLCLHRYDFVPLTSGTTNRRKLTQPGLLNAEFRLAPLAEQSRIVARVTELRRLCADLRQRLASAQATQSRLADALVESALA